MNATEGLRRIAAVVRWIGYLSGAVFIVAATTADLRSTTGSAILVGIGIAIGAIGWVVAWIIEGFAKPKA